MPLYFDILDSILLKKLEDVLGYFVGSVSRGRAGIDANPNHDQTKSLLPILSMGDKTSRIDGVAIGPISHQLANLGTDGAPDIIERGAVDSKKGLGRQIRMLAAWLNPRIFG